MKKNIEQIKKIYPDIDIDEKNYKYVNFLNNVKETWTKNIRFNEEEEKFKNLLILGKPSLGKTFLTKNIFSSYKYDDRQSSRSVFYIDETTFVEKIYSWDAIIRSQKDFWCDLKDYILEWMAKVPLLIYDDIGTIAPNNKMFNIYLQKMNYVLNKRNYDKTKRTIIISNLTRENLINFDKRIGERIQEKAWILVFKSTELKSYRINSSIKIDL